VSVARVRPTAAVAAALLVVGLALLAVYDAPLPEALLYLAYEGVFVVLPGWLVYSALSSRPGGALHRLAIGWGLGYALEVLAFVATAAAGVRWLLPFYPLVACAAALLVLRRRGQGAGGGDALQRGLVWAVAALCAVAMAYLAVAFFPFAPLPGEQAVNYFQDYPWALAIAAEAKHHWPIEDPGVSGEPFVYHWFVHVHWAAASQVTGLELPLVYFRLFMLPMTVALVLQGVVAGRVLTCDYRTGALAVALILLVGELQLDTTNPQPSNLPFVGVLFTFLVVSPSFLFGLVFLLPLLTLIGRHLAAGEDRWRGGDWLVVALLAGGASQAKVSILPLLLGALAVFAAWTWATQRRPPLRPLSAMALLLAVTVALYLSTYSGHSSGVSLDLGAGFRFVGDMAAVALIDDRLGEVLPDVAGKEALLACAGFIAGLTGLLAAQLCGLAWVLRRGFRALDDRQRWLISVFAVGLASFLFLDGEGTGNQLYGFFYGVVAACVLSAQGLMRAWSARRELDGLGLRLGLVAAVGVALLAALFVVPVHLDLTDGSRYLLWYGGLLGVLALVYGLARAALRPQPWAAPLLVAAALVAVGLLDKPVDTLRPALTDPPEQPTSGRRVTPALYGALEWIRDNSPDDAVVAANNHHTEIGPFEYVYGGFGERRVFLQGWGYSTRARDSGYVEVVSGEVMPFGRRLALNQAAFQRGSLAALRLMSRGYGVRYLIVDEVNGYGADQRQLRRAATIVYRAPGVAVFELVGEERLEEGAG
jgi:hypothetical protein